MVWSEMSSLVDYRDSVIVHVHPLYEETSAMRKSLPRVIYLYGVATVIAVVALVATPRVALADSGCVMRCNDWNCILDSHGVGVCTGKDCTMICAT
jgi:hypothetical protein